MMKRMTALLLALAMLVSVMPGMTLGVTAEGEGASAPAMTAAPEGHDHTSHDGWTAWPTDGTVPTSGKYYLTEEVTTLSNAWAVNGDFMLCLNGKELKAPSGIKTTRASGGAFTICDCTASYSTEGVYTAGKITGARINIARNTKLNLCDGILTGSSVGSNGAAVYLGQGDKSDGLAGAVFNMYDGMITDNHATGSQNGGAVAVGGIGGTGTNTPAPGQFNMAGGTISNNSAGGNGGAIYTLGGGAVVNIYGGTIENNTATGNGGAVNASSDSQIHVSNVLICGNQAKQGGGINTAATASLTVSGSVVVAGNTAAGSASNVYLGVSDTVRSMVTVGAEGLTGDAWIGVGMYSPRSFTTALGGKNYTANFFGDNSDYSVALEGDALTLTAAAAHEHCICGAAGCADETHEKVAFKAWNDPFSLPESGNWYLVKDVQMGDQVTVAADTTLNLCLNGKTVTAAEGDRHFYVSGTLNLTDCATEMGMLTGGNPSANGGSVYVDYNNAVFNLWNGKLYDNHLAGDKTGGAVYMRQATSSIAGGVFNMYGGEISGNSAPNAGAVMVSGHSTSANNKEPYSQFNMYGGKIVDNSSSVNGAAIYAQREATINLQGGTIKDNTATGNGGAVYASGSYVSVGNVEVSNNSAAKYGGIYLSSTASLTVSGSPLIASNTGNNVYLGISGSVGAMITVGADGLTEDAWIGVGMSAPRSFTTALGGKNYVANFFSDNSDYSVALESDALTLTAAAGHEHCICGAAGCTDETHEKVAFKAWNDPYSLPESGSWYLVKDVTLDAQYNMGTANLCLNGHTVTQTAAGQRVIYVNSDTTVSITDCNATPGGLTSAPGAGGASLIGVRNTATLNLWNGKLYGNTKDGEGAAVYLNEASGSNKGATFNMYGGEISGNNGKNGAAVMVNGHNKDSYDANQPYTQFNMYGGKITGNTVSANGGAIYAQREATVNLQGGIIEGNTATGNGGVVYASASYVTVAGTTQIEKNTAGKGGAIYGTSTTTITVTGGSFTGNKATTTESNTGGGAIYTEGTLKVSNATFSENVSGYMGGAIYLHETATATLTGVTFRGNTSASNGGAISSRFCPVTADGCVFEGNTAGGNGGAIQGNNAKLILKNTTFTNNTSGNVGGAIYASSKQAMEMTDCTVTGNTAVNAGAMALYGGSWVITDTKITENTAEKSGAGAVYLRYSSYGVNSTTLAGTTTVTGNTEGGSSRNIYVADEDAGKEPYLTIAEGFTGTVGIYMPSTRADVAELAYISANTVADTTGFFSDNTNYTIVLKDGRLYYQWGHSHCICGTPGCTEHEQVRFKSWSDATKLPGSGNYYLTVDVVLTKQTEIDTGDTLNLCLCGHTVTQTTVGQKHIAIGKGATVSITDCQETVGGLTSTVEANVAAITVSRNGGTLNLWNGKIYGNTGKEGAAVSVFQAQGSEKGAVFNMYGGEISGNTATNVAGAVMISGHHETDYDDTLPYSEFNMYGGKITGNTAVNDGGAIYAQREASVNLYGGIIENNTAGDQGGAVFASGSTVKLEGTTVSGNTAKNAGAVYASGGTQVTVSGGKITGNTASSNGGGLYSTGAETVITVSGGEISGNKAGNAGGGAIVETKSTFNLTGGTITGNTAAYGGGIYTNNASNLNMTGGEVSKNTSEKTGGGIYIYKGVTAVFDGGKILENTASTNGGGMYITGEGATVALNSVTIQKNTASGKGGGVYIYTSAEQLTLSGKPVISSNKAAGKTSNLHLAGERVMELGTMDAKAKVGVTVDGLARVISNTINTDYSASFTSDLSSRKVVYLNNVLQLQVSSDHVHCLCAAEVAACDHSEVVWEAWSDTTSLPTAGNYYLTKNVQLSKAIEVTDELNLCLNGRTVKAGENTFHILVAQGGKLSITDCAKTTGKLTGGNYSGSGGSVRVAREAQFNLYKGKLTGNTSGNSGGAVYVWMGTEAGSGGVFNMYGGLIYENSTKANGGGVCTGGASNGAEPSQFNLYGGTIRNNTSTSGGGGVYIGDGGTMTMTDGIVKDNSAKYGGGIYLNGAKATLSGGYVKGNMAKYQVTVTDGKETKSGGNGGGVYIRASEATLSGVLIYENVADAAGGGVCTARITSTVNGETVSRVSTVTMNGSKIYKNSATHAGGLLIQSMATFTMKDGSVYSNTASSSKGTSGNGGGFYVNNATLNVEGGTIKTNKAVSYGGGIYSENKAQLNISGGEILSNTAKYGAGIAQKQSTAELSGGTVTKNTASGNGGGLYVRAAETKLSGIVITANTAKVNGGGICTARVTETVDGVQKEYTSTIEMTGGEVSKNKSVKNGGGMLIQSRTVFTMKGGTVTGNTGVYGAGIYVSLATVELPGGKISGNSASKNGGGLYVAGSVAKLSGVTISGNSAKTNGGGVTTAKATETVNGVKKEHYSTITMTGGTISGNTAKSNAGGILVQSKAVLKLSGGTVTGNTATSSGGGIFISTDSSLQMTGGTVSKNHAERYGGGIYMMRSENSIKNATITGNTAVKNGGGLYLPGADLIIENTKITDNVAESAGGALTTAKATISTDFGYNEYRYSTLTMTNCTLSGNQATTAGALVLQSNATADISNTTFTGNVASNSAGAIYIGSGEITFTDLIFENNTAGKQGGAIQSGANESNTLMTRCSFTGNTAGTNGGAIQCRSNMELVECTITGNSAGEYGGAIGTGKQGTRSNYQEGLTVRSSTIDGNTAGTQGGGIYLILGIKGAIYDTAITNNKANAEGGAIWAVDDLTMDGLKATGNTSGGNGYAVWLDDANYDGHSYFTGRMKLGGNAQITDNKGGDLYMGKEVVISMTSAGLQKDAKINVTLDSGLLTNRVYGAYNYEGGNCVYTITYGDRSLTEPEYAEPVSQETEPTEGTEGTNATEPKAENTLLYAGVGAFAVVIAAIALIVVLVNKKKKAGKTAEGSTQE